MSKQTSDDFKKMIQKVVNAMVPANYEIATVTEEDEGEGPTIQAEGYEEEFDKDAIIIPEQFTDHEIETGEGTVEVKNHLKKDDKVILLGQPGGQVYIVLGRIT